MTTAERLFKVLDDYNHWDVLDNDYTVEQAEIDIAVNPTAVINALIDIIKDLEE